VNIVGGDALEPYLACELDELNVDGIQLGYASVALQFDKVSVGAKEILEPVHCVARLIQLALPHQ